MNKMMATMWQGQGGPKESIAAEESATVEERPVSPASRAGNSRELDERLNLGRLLEIEHELYPKSLPRRGDRA